MATARLKFSALSLIGRIFFVFLFDVSPVPLVDFSLAGLLMHQRGLTGDGAPCRNALHAILEFALKLAVVF